MEASNQDSILSKANLASLVKSLLELVDEAERLPFVAVKLLWSLTFMPEVPKMIEDAGAIPSLLGILRAAEDPMLACSTLVLVARLAKTRPHIAALLLKKGGAPSLLLRLLLRWQLELEAVIALLQIFEVALSIPCHRTLLTVEVKDPSDRSDNPRLLRLPTALKTIAEASKVVAASAEADIENFVEASAAFDAWQMVSLQAARLADEWQGLAKILG
eukprot:TRINITY_DN17005_c0_g2_i1.p2 TRINITY_DN17005_c0_g2~~TRINITY_DN17005_c0_g2_i1.p2  ORF type:complete len:217 (-),score=52.60 TRINITY_DN17005_c0_g2_i1:488-1138(-)